MQVHHVVNRGIMGDNIMHPNTDLIGLARAHNYKLPFSFHPTIFDKTLLQNDFKKFTLAYNWCPDLEALSLASRAMQLLYQPFMYGSVKSIDEAWAQMDKTKSPGYPWNKVYKTKQQVIDNEGQLLRLIIADILAGRKPRFKFNGCDYDNLFYQTSPKGEFKPLEKIINPDPEKRKTRTFLCCDIVTHTLNYMVFAEQNDNLLHAHKNGRWMRLGMTPFYGGWDAEARYLMNSEAKRFFNCYDLKHCEASLKEQVLRLIYAMRFLVIIFGDEYNPEILKNFIFNQTCYSYVIDVDGWLCMMFGCNPSGGFCTLSDNCFAVELTALYSLAKKYRTLPLLMEAVSKHNVSIMGDDSVFPVHSDFEDLVADASDLGFEYVPEALNVDIHNVVFLNNRFHMMSTGIFVPCANMDKIRANIYFHFKKRSWRLAYVKCCAYRVLAWNFPVYLREAEDLIQFIRKHFDHVMKCEGVPELTYHSAITAYLPAKQIDFMWFGNERFVRPICTLPSCSQCPRTWSSFVDLLSFALDL